MDCSTSPEPRAPGVSATDRAAAGTLRDPSAPARAAAARGRSARVLGPGKDGRRFQVASATSEVSEGLAQLMRNGWRKSLKWERLQK